MNPSCNVYKKAGCSPGFMRQTFYLDAQGLLRFSNWHCR